MRDLPIPDVPIEAPSVVAASPHVAAIGAIGAAIYGWIPVIVTLIPAIYYLILIWQTSTVQHFVRNWRMRRQGRRFVKLQAKAKVAKAALDAEELVRSARAAAKETIAVAAATAKTDAVKDAVALEQKVPPV